MTLQAIFTFIGGIGLFLLGMRMMTDGLKVAAGNTLRDILVSATRSRLRGVASGILITAMVQSSSAVIFATIGFVNAGLLTLAQAIGVIYGSNVGTTLTSWLVAVIGFNVNLQAFALPAIGIGMGLWVTMGGRRRGALGQALAGLGLFFLGIDILKDTFSGTGDTGQLAAWAEYGNWSLVLFVLAGIALTTLVQSSSAALAVTLTAAGGGMIPLTAAAAMVIGANVGTTSTALFAIIGATPTAKRAALAHVSFNVITALVAIVTLPLLMMLVREISDLLRLGDQPATLLAIFHTMTKLLGLLIMWPATDFLVTQLEKRFKVIESQEGRPKYLDKNVQSTPSLALDALAMELDEMGKLTRQSAREVLSSENTDPQHPTLALASLEKLNLAVGEFAGGIHRQDSDTLLSAALPNALRVAQYFVNVAEHALEFHQSIAKAQIEDEKLAQEGHQLRAEAINFLKLFDTGEDSNEPDYAAIREAAEAFEKHYDSGKNHILIAGARGQIRSSHMAAVLEQLNALHRIIKQSTKAARYLEAFYQAVHPDADEQTDETKEDDAIEEKKAQDEKENQS